MSKATARTHWVWTEKAAGNWDNRFNGRKRIAGQPIKGETEKSKEADAGWKGNGMPIRMRMTKAETERRIRREGKQNEPSRDCRDSSARGD